MAEPSRPTPREASGEQSSSEQVRGPGGDRLSRNSGERGPPVLSLMSLPHSLSLHAPCPESGLH